MKYNYSCHPGYMKNGIFCLYRNRGTSHPKPWREKDRGWLPIDQAPPSLNSLFYSPAPLSPLG